MPKLFSLLCFFYILLCSLCADNSFDDSYPSFSPTQMREIKSHDLRSYKRILHYNEYLHRLKDLPKKEQLLRLNLYLNGLLSEHDEVTNASLEHWATPKEFLRLGFGDCEDYALIKYYTLLKLGFDAKKLYLLAVKEQFTQGDHMVLVYFEDAHKAPLVLDNLSFRVLPLDKRVDLKAEYFLNTHGVYKQKSDGSLEKIAPLHILFEEIRKKVAQNL